MAPTAPASYKKKDGELLLDINGKNLTWRPADSASTSAQVIDITIPVDTITNLQATPPTSAKAMIKVFVQHPTTGTVDPYVFTFAGSHDEAAVLKTALTAAIQASKSATIPESLAVSEVKAANPSRYNKFNRNKADHELQNDMSLQQAVLSASPGLQRKFHEAVISDDMTPSQFWSTRINLLRAYAAEQSQTRGSYNVLASIKPRAEDSVVRVSLSREQIHAIFEQHPVIRRVYDEVVPKLREDEFWRRFFLSKLYKKLKGEKLVPTDSHDDVLDSYLKSDPLEIEVSPSQQKRVPHIIDIGGNEDNHSQKQGNRPDLTMRPNRIENVPIIRSLNSLSSKLIDSVTPIDMKGNASDIQGYQLRDLQVDFGEKNILLNVKNHRQFFDSEVQPDLKIQEPTSLDHDLRGILSDLYQNTTSHRALNLKEKYSSDAPKTWSAEEGYSSLRAAHSHISSILVTHRVQMPGNLINISLPNNEIWDQLLLTHATSAEFLRNFWVAFFSGDSRKTSDIRNMVGSLNRSLERIETIATSAENIERLKSESESRDTDRKRQKGSRLAPSNRGYALVKRIMAPQEIAINSALSRYRQALQGHSDGF